MINDGNSLVLKLGSQFTPSVITNVVTALWDGTREHGPVQTSVFTDRERGWRVNCSQVLYTSHWATASAECSLLSCVTFRAGWRGCSHFWGRARYCCGSSVRRSSTFSRTQRTSISTSTSTPHFHFQPSPFATKVRSGASAQCPLRLIFTQYVSLFLAT